MHLLTIQIFIYNYISSVLINNAATDMIQKKWIYGNGKVCRQLRLLVWTSFIGQFSRRGEKGSIAIRVPAAAPLDSRGFLFR